MLAIEASEEGEIAHADPASTKENANSTAIKKKVVEIKAVHMLKYKMQNRVILWNQVSNYENSELTRR